jgi:hypothetical protein
MSLKPWREIAIPHEDVLKGTFQQAEFAADLSRVHEGSATPEYQDATLFYKRTFITEGMKLLLDSVVRRLSGCGGDPVIQLQTAFGGGKTHTMLAVYHLAKGVVAASDLVGIPPILDVAGVTELPKAHIVVLDGTRFAPGQPKIRNGVTVRTLWGELAWQLGGIDSYRMVEESDVNGTAPDSEVLQQLLAYKEPVIILVDELLAYVRQFEEGRSYPGGTFESNLTFIQNLTQALKAVPRAVLLVSLPESKQSEAGSIRGQRAMDRMEHILSQESLEKVFGRVHALWKPVATEEAFEIVRRRLFNDVRNRQEVEAVCRGFADYYLEYGQEFPPETQESRYYERLISAYPIHPEVFDRLYEDWSSLDNFQRTRGVLKLMAKVIHRLWKDNNQDLLILPGSLPLYDADTRNEAIYYLPPGWDPVLERDIDGDRAETTEIENHDTRFGSVQACRRTARAIFLGSAPSASNHMVRGLEIERLLLGVAQPGQTVGLFRDAIRRLEDRLHYMNHANSRFWFDTKPNLRREMEERKRRYYEKEHVLPIIRDRVQRSLGGGVFHATHVFTASADIPDDTQLRLVVLPLDAVFSRSAPTLATDWALEILRNRGDQPRQKQNRLLYLAADYDVVSRLKDQVRSVLSWQSIVKDSQEMRLNLDQFQLKQANESLDGANKALDRMVRETYKWVLSPMQEVTPSKGISEIKWEQFAINASSPSMATEILRVLKENEILITEWAPVHLARLLKDWFWKDASDVSAMDVWQKSCTYLYMPRLKNDEVFRSAIEAGSDSRDFFAVAQGKENDQYVGFTFGKRTGIFLDHSLLLIEPHAAIAFEAQKQATNIVLQPGTNSGSLVRETPFGNSGGLGPAMPAVPPLVPDNKTHFYGSIELDPVRAKVQFNDLVDEVINHFMTKPGVRVKINIDVEAQADEGFDDSLQRVIKENCSVLKFKAAEFEK